MTSQELMEEIHRICTLVAAVELEEREQLLIDEVNKLPDQHARDAIIAVVTVTVRFTKDTVEKKMAVWEKITLGIAGATSLVVLLVIAIVFPQPTAFQVFIFRTILAFAGAAAAAVIPGALHVEGTVKNLTIRAGGAIAVFVIIYLLNPPALLHH
jgi:hypothetical protein